MNTNVLPGYKQTEVGVIPEDWHISTLGEISTMSSGTTPSRNLLDRYYRNGTIHWVKTLDLNDSVILNTDELVTSTAIKETSLRLYTIDTVLVAMYGGFNQIGRTGLLRITAAVNQAITAIQPRSSILLPEYLLAVLNSRVNYWKTVASSSRKDPNITSCDIRAFPIACPPLPEQRAMAAALSDVDALLAKLDQLIAKKRNLKQAAMQQLLTGQTRLPGFSGEWEVRRFGDLFQFLSTANNPRADLAEFGDVGYVHYGDIHTTNSAFLNCSEMDLPTIAKDRVAGIPFIEDGDLVMADASEDYAGIGKCIEVKNVRDHKIVGGLHTFLLRGNKGLLANGFKGYLQFIPTVKAALIRFATGISVYGVSKNNVRSIEVQLPKANEQTAIAAVLSDMDAEIAALEARRDKTHALKQGMMQELLTGGIRLI